MLNSRFDTDVLPEELTFRLLDERVICADDIEPLQYQPSSLHGTLDESLYESIKQVGLQTPLVVAQAPTQKHFVPIAGGNSRLQALSRLYNETGHQSYSNIQCVVAEWPGVIRARLGHVITNQVRMHYSFASRSIAIVHIAKSEYGSRSLCANSQRDVVHVLNSNGYPISQSTISYMVYLAHRLAPCISQELLDSLSMIDTRELREIESQTHTCWQDRIDSSEDFGELFARVLVKTGSDSSDGIELIEKVRYEANYLTGWSDTKVRQGIDQLPTQVGDTTMSTEIRHQPDKEIQNQEHSKIVVSSKSQAVPVDDSKHREYDKNIRPYSSEKARKKAIAHFSIGELRESAWNLAYQICKSYGLSEYILKSQEKSGYQVVAKPNAEPSSMEYRVWAYLDVFAGSDSRPLSVNLWSELTDNEWRILTELWDVVREIRKNKHAGPSISLPNHMEVQRTAMNEESKGTQSA